MTGTDCLEHTWLKRQIRPQLAPKPCNVPPPKYKTTPSTPSPPPPPVCIIQLFSIFCDLYTKKTP